MSDDVQLFKIGKSLAIAHDAISALRVYLKENEMPPCLSVQQIMSGDVSARLTRDDWQSVFPGVPSEAVVDVVVTASVQSWIKHYRGHPDRWARRAVFALADEVKETAQVQEHKGERRMGKAKVAISWELLASLLDLPDGTDVEEIVVKADKKSRLKGSRILVLTVSHSDLRDETPAPLITPRYEQGVPRVRFLSWGQEDSAQGEPL